MGSKVAFRMLGTSNPYLPRLPVGLLGEWQFYEAGAIKSQKEGTRISAGEAYTGTQFLRAIHVI